ncbi:MAG: glycosyltransferase family 2 protein [Legionellaceae bacterium]|nr:glycosyltransferase family 2 protein [Legionellaceae bacterium]
MNKLKLTVITPVYNEEQGIAHFHKRTRAILDTLENLDAEILFVVDRSTDNTIEVLRSIVSNDTKSRVLTLSSRFGHQMALLAGVEHSPKADIIVMMDSDLQHPPELIPRLLEEFYKGAAIVYTIRRHTEKGNPVRRLVGSLFYRILNIVSQIKINPNAADFRLINRKVADTLITNFSERNMFLRSLFSWIGFKQVSIEFSAEPRFAGKSKYSLSQMFRLAISGILSFSTRPLYTGLLVGFTFATIAFILIIGVIISYFVNHNTPSGWSTLTILFLFFSSVQLITLGIIGAYIGGIYEEVKKRPRYIIDEEIS